MVTENPDETTPAEMREELRLVDEELISLRQEAADLRRRVDQDGPGDSADQASLLTSAEEQEIFITNLQRRRDALVRQLGQT